MKKTARQTIVLYLLLFWTGFANYISIEFCFRGYSFICMGVLGGVSLLFIDGINDYISMKMDLLLQGIIGGAFITIAEIIVGNVGLFITGIRMWDYTNLPFNACNGFICPQFSFLWVLMSILCVFVGDSLRYYVFHGYVCPSYSLLGYTFKFPRRECSK